MHRRIIPRPALPPPQPRPQLPATRRRRLHASLQHGPLRPPLLRQPHHPHVRHDRGPGHKPRCRHREESRQLDCPGRLTLGCQWCWKRRGSVAISSIDQRHHREGPDSVSAEHCGWGAAEDVCQLARYILRAVCGRVLVLGELRWCDTKEEWGANTSNLMAAAW